MAQDLNLFTAMGIRQQYLPQPKLSSDAQREKKKTLEDVSEYATPFIKDYFMRILSGLTAPIPNESDSKVVLTDSLSLHRKVHSPETGHCAELLQ